MAKKTITLKTWLFMNLGILLMAIGIYFFKAPNGFATGGVSGMAIILANVFPFLTQSVYMMIINVALLVVGVLVGVFFAAFLYVRKDEEK